LTPREQNENILNLRSTGKNDMSANPQPEPDRLDEATDQAIAACGGDVRTALKAMIAANEQLQASVSNGYTRGSLPRDRKDWYD
jgi:hypothetical protein